jgi:DNA-directed RNA polymerase specialized sigma24 family protein
MSPPSSVSRWLDALKEGDSQAATPLWERYCAELVRLARKKLGHLPRRAADEEDVALSAFNSLCLGVRNGRFPDLTDRDSLWRLLVFITAQKAADQIVHERRKKRGGGDVRGHSAVSGGDAGSGACGFDRIFGRAPGPETLNIWAEQYERLLNKLDDATLRTIAELRVQAYSIDEIAERLGLARRTVHRKLHLMRSILHAEAAS